LLANHENLCPKWVAHRAYKDNGLDATLLTDSGIID